jgi:hypothetical protein
MSGQKIITASLEGMRVLVDEKQCELQEYNFTSNQWFSKDTAPWPLPRGRADEWLAGWNDVDRFAAVSALTKAPSFPAAPLNARPLGEPRL